MSSIEDIHPNIIIKSRNTILFEGVFRWKEVQENHLLKIKIEASSSDHHESENDEIELIKSKKAKMTKTFGPDFKTYLLENEP